MARGLLLVLVLAICGGGAYALFRPRPVTQDVPPPPVTKPAETPKVPPVTAQVPKPSPAPTQKEPAVILYPDGKAWPALNGVTTSVKIAWNGKFSPVKEKVKDKDWEWYKHEDGSYSTVRMIAMNGVDQPMTIVANPTEARPPLDDASLQKMLEERGKNDPNAPKAK